MATPVDGTRERLIAAAREVFAERGLEGAGVAEIARRAGLTTGAIYSQFGGKLELLLEAIDSARPDDARIAFGGPAPAHAADTLHALGGWLIDPSRANSQLLLAECFMAARRDPTVRDVMVRRVADNDDRFAAFIEAGKRDGSFDDHLDTDTLAFFCRVMGFGVMMYRIVDRSMPDQEAWDAVLRRVVAALGPNATAPSGNGAADG